MERRSGLNIGFTLLEVMVAMAILAGSLSAIIGLTGNAMIRSGRAEKMLVATMLARQKMAEIEIDIEKGRQKGEFPDEKSEDGKFEEPFENYTWKMEIKRVELPAPVMGEKGSMQDVVGKQLTKEISLTVRELNLSVLWKDRGEEQSYDLVTHIVKL
ncbi:MAG: type II secretion system protein [Pseudomonadota bacterium]